MARKIEVLMNQAITASKDWKCANTEVVNEDGVSIVKLHGNRIAEVGDTWLKLYDGGWQTSTTKSRLNAILQAHGNGEGIYQKDYQWFINLNGTTQPFVSGILLN